jgi:hypothetical protein
MPVHQGDVIEAFIGGSWIAVTYEWSRNVDDVAYGFFEGGDVCVSLKSYVDLRWPLAN